MKLKPISMGLAAMVGLLGSSCIYEGRHRPTDVAASYLRGTAYVIGLTALYRRVKVRERGAEW
jgi:membrane-associated phospholipid phosphatase